MSSPSGTRFSHWTLPEANGVDSLILDENASIDGPLGDEEVAVELHAASLNYRELVIVKVPSPTCHTRLCCQAVPSPCCGTWRRHYSR